MSVGTTLGLDIGTNSVGWALVREEDGAPKEIVGCGVRVFEAGVNLDAKSGLTESRNIKRREARQRRRQLARHSQRKRAVHRILAEVGLLPRGTPSHQNAEWRPILDSDPYALRAKALDAALDPHELGRVIYHLAERRGFKSNRKRPVPDDDHGTVKDGIKRLSAELNASKARTLGEYFARLNPHEVRIRSRFTRRDWYEDEFKAIWEAQKQHHGTILTDATRDALAHALFHQRPLRIRAGLLGKCELDPRHRRAPMALLHAQEFRCLQDLNNLRIDDGSDVGLPLPADARAAILHLMETRAEITFGALRRIPALKGCRFNMEHGERKTISGNETASKLRSAIGDQWSAMDQAARDRLVNDLLSIEDETRLRKRLSEKWKFDSAATEALCETVLDDDHCSLSSSAIRKLLPHMRDGLSYRDAVDRVEWPTDPAAEHALLPGIRDNIRNPIVQRSLAETRRVVNAVIARWGKPTRMRVELARELKLNREDRADFIQSMRKRETERQQAREELVRHGLPDPKGRDIEKWLLLQECRGKCPYTGRQIGFADLFQSGEFDIEHILPFSRSFDDSFANKTLCHAKANRVEKRERTPFEVYGNTKDWDAITGRVREFTGPFADEKLRRFLIEDLPGDAQFLDSFTNRQMNDTRYASVRAAKYLRCLYPESERLRAVQVTTGRVTGYLRNAWNLNRILGDGPRKTRDDHRHHAVDALCVALTEPSIVKVLSDASARWSARGGRVSVFRGIPEPWKGFAEQAEAAIAGIVVSHRVSRKVQGQLHKETHFGLIKDPEAISRDKAQLVAVKRCRLEEITKSDVANIVDKAIREIVSAALGDADPSKHFKNGQNTPVLRTRDGRQIPIRRVRVRYGRMDLISFGPERNVSGGNNHHLAVFAKADKPSDPWMADVVPTLDAMNRIRKGLPAVAKTSRSGMPLLFSLMQADTVEITHRGIRGKAMVMGLSKRDFTFRWINDARPKARLGDDLIRITSVSALQASGVVKLSVDPLGAVCRAND